MPFQNWGKPSFQIGEDVYILDPELPDTQYRCRIMMLDPVQVALWPDQNIEPNFQTLSKVYLLSGGITSEDLVKVPHLQRVVRGYAAQAAAQGVDAPWEPAQATPALPLCKREDPSPATKDPVPVTETTFEVGDVVEVLPSDSEYWSKLQGQTGTILAINQPNMVTVEIQGSPCPDVLAVRFRKVQGAAEDQKDAAPTDAGEQQALPEMWVGRKIHIQDKVTAGASFRGVCEAVTEEGVQIQGFKVPIAWERVGEIKAMEEEPVPGDQKDALRLALEKMDRESTYEEVIEQIGEILASAKPKETLGKKAFRELIGRWDLLQTKKPTTSENVTTVDAMTYQSGYSMACEEIIEKINLMNTF